VPNVHWPTLPRVKRMVLRCSFGLIGFLLLGPCAQADTVVPSGYQAIARLTQVPAHYVYGMALHESGKKLDRLASRPWPWTLNVEGKAHYYPTRQACWQALTHYLSQGKQRIDIGLMQVNWHYHQKKLKNPWQSLDPYFNLQVGARLLRNEYDRNHNWYQAIGRYHSPGQQADQKQRAIHYANNVFRQIENLRIRS